MSALDGPGHGPRRGRLGMAAAAAVVAALAAAAYLFVSGADREDPAPSPGTPRGSGDTAAAPESLPIAKNVLMIVMDTTRADRCGFLGWDRSATLSAAPDAMRSPTPRLDEFARECLVYEDAWSAAPWTFPSHCAFFTGLLPDRLGLHTSERKILRNDVPTLASSLLAEGFATACYTSNTFVDPLRGTARGFETFDPVWKATEPPGGSAEVSHRRALAWIRAQRADGRRFFAFINDMEAHGPRNPSAAWARRLMRSTATAEDEAAARDIEEVETIDVRAASQVPAPVLAAYSDLYDAEIATVDHEIGRLLDALRADGVLDETLVVILSDHGEGLGDHGWLTHGGFIHRELLRVPLLVRLPGGAAARRVPDLVRLVDLFPTVLERCGVAVPPGIDGVPLLGASTAAPAGPRTAFAWESVWGDLIEIMVRRQRTETIALLAMRRRSVRHGRHHLILDSRGGVELYDDVADPAELQNLADAQPETVVALRKLLDARPGH